MTVDRNYDVAVIGGGSAGVAAAVGASRAGANTVLIEAAGCLGGAQDALALPVSRVKKVPFREGKVFGMGPAIWFMRLLDYLETR